MPEAEGSEAEEFMHQVGEEASRLIEDYPGKQRDLRDAVEHAFNIVTPGELRVLLENQDLLCTRCGECCRRCMSIALTDSDVNRIARFLDWDRVTFINRLRLKPTETANIWIMPAGPCPFFEEPGRCGIYQARPEVCRSFPTSLLAYGVATGVLEIPLYCEIVRKFFTAKVLKRVSEIRGSRRRGSWLRR